MKNVIMFPGQGSQYKGMGKDLFSSYKTEVTQASNILGYDLEELCIKDPNRELGKTQFTQPALYVVNALTYYERFSTISPDYLIGHSLGEYNALLAANAFDFLTGLKLVKKRGELMAAASGGGMAAVLGLDVVSLQEKLDQGGYTEIDIANYNTPSQTVISGPQENISAVVKDFGNQDIKIIPLFVSAPFHSRYMKPAAEEFETFLKGYSFDPLTHPVISNVTARPYQNQNVADLLSQQIESSVKWFESIQVLMGKGVTQFDEVGSAILSKMVKEVQSNCTPIVEEKVSEPSEEIKPFENDELAYQLGSKTFRENYGIKYAYLTGAMYRGIASKELVVRMGKANLLGYLGTGGMSLREIEEDIKFIQKELKPGQVYGMNLLHNMANPQAEMDTVQLYLNYGIKKVEASAFMQITPSLVYYRLKGLKKDENDVVVCENKVLAKISRPEVAEEFMRPAPERIVNKLLDQGLITQEQADLSRLVSMSTEICVEADSGGHTDGGVALVLLPAMKSLRTQLAKEFDFAKSISIGLAGGIGTPESIACAFVMGADFVLTGSINQCTVEAGTSDVVKDLLQEINVQDTDYAPAGDMFEIGAKVQVLKKGVLFPARANKLYALYQQYDSIEDLPTKTKAQLEKSYFKRSISEVWEETKTYLTKNGEETTIVDAEQKPKKKMALIFKWYFGYSNQLSFKAEVSDKVNFQIHTGPALGAFNQWVKGTPLENWRNRHSDEMATKLMDEAANCMKSNLLTINSN